MALKKTCTRCNRSGVLLRLDGHGHCAECAAAIAKEAAAIAREKRKLETEPMNKFCRSMPSQPVILDGLPLVYHYRNISITDVNRDILRCMYTDQDYSLELSIDDDGAVVLTKWDGVVGRLCEKNGMVIDWIHQQAPVTCEIMNFRMGAEAVALAFYRDEQARFVNHNSAVVKLTSFMSESKQDDIACLYEGQKLFVDEDDNGKFYVRTIHYSPIGNLPAKYAQMYDDGEINALFFDHAETSERDNGDDMYIPFVKIYY